MRARAGLFAALALALLSCGCSRSDAPPPERGPATVIDPSTTGSIVGTVSYAGVAPSPAKLSMSGDPSCTAAHPGPADAGDVVVRDGKVSSAVVFVEKGLEGKVFERSTSAVVVDQTGCMFTPRITVAETGQSIVFANGDTTLHNVHTTPKNSPGVNFGLAQRGARRTVHIDAAEVMVGVRCDVHPWMRAFVGVLDHPYFAVTSGDGAFRLGRVPAGGYILGVWHERFGKKSEPVTVVAGRTTTLEFRYGE